MDKYTEVIRKRYNRTARFYNIMENMMDKSGMNSWRKAVWNEARGKVLEVGVGAGKNMEYYTEDIEVTAIDFSEKMLEKASNRSKELSKKVDLRLMDVQALQFPDEYFDTVITTCVFCSVPDPVKGLTEIRRVCKKDGKIIMLEHVRSKKILIGKLMDILNPVVVRIIGANINRNTVDNLKRAGLNVEFEKDLMMDIVKHLECKKDS
jgi:ubiquinone/menaquinone biosynthesis C-methylase UbiE